MKLTRVDENEIKYVSLPSWERGLKYQKGATMVRRKDKSLPSWERGLKWDMIEKSMAVLAAVALFAGAWIEIT